MKKKINKISKEKGLQTFIITIKDSYRECTYSFSLPEDVSFINIAETIAKKFKVKTPCGHFSVDEGIEF